MERIAKLSTKQMGRRGIALPLVMSVLVLMLAMSVGVLALSRHSRVFSIRTGNLIEARCAADAGLVKALYEMNTKVATKPWDGYTLPQANDEQVPNCDAVYSYVLNGDTSSGFTLDVTGKSGHIERHINCNLPVQGPFEYAVFGVDGVDFKYGVQISGYNFDYDDKPLKVGTFSIDSGAITLYSNAGIDGDVVVGVGGVPDDVVELKNGASVTGSIYAMSEAESLTSIVVPGWLSAMASGGTIKNNKTITSSGKYDEINLKNSKTLKIHGDISLYITGDVTLGNSAEVEIDSATDSSLVLYIGGDYEGKNGSTLNNETQDPARLKIYGLDGCQSMVFKNSSELYGAIYAPNASIVFNNSTAAYGAVVGKQFEQKNSAVFNYDASLRDADVDDQAVRFVVTKWRE